jgi:alkanesulfonate monooxygenase SsuD/methylene tetrahydromethanopterin reductase-like flavin-dependent oxidoreductase (luciferase family)
MSMRFSVMGTMNLSWREVLEAALLAEDLGFDAMYTSDHLHAVAGFSSDIGSLDALALAIALAPLTSRIRLGCLVSPITVRHPVVLARALQTLDHVSEGRAEAGVGAGWNRNEHETFGLGFPGSSQRLDMLEDACAAITALWERPGPVSLDGWYPLRDACLTPRPVQSRVPLLVAGASDRAVAIAAAWATRWNATGSPAYLADRIQLLRQLEAQAGRAVGSIEATSMVRPLFSNDRAELARLKTAMSAESRGPRAQARTHLPSEGPLSALYIGRSDGFSEYLAGYEQAGVQRTILTIPRPWSPTLLRELAGAAGLAS